MLEINGKGNTGMKGIYILPIYLTSFMRPKSAKTPVNGYLKHVNQITGFY